VRVVKRGLPRCEEGIGERVQSRGNGGMEPPKRTVRNEMQN